MVKGRPTIKDVARKAGLSLSTVSLALNNRGYVSPDTRERVLRVAGELAYHPTRAAKGLASKTSGNIGFILSEDHFSQAEPFYTRIFLGTEFEARNHNYYILLTTVRRQFKADVSVPRFLLERFVDGVIIAGEVNDNLISYIDSLGIPIVLVDYEMKRRRHSAVLIDNWRGATLAVQHLLDLGHRSIGFIGGDLEHPSINDRFHAYQQILREHGLSPEGSMTVVDGRETTIDSGFAAAEKLFRSGGKPSAVFAANDAMAIGCMRWAREAGITIPADLAVVGFDDIDMASHVEPGLTTIHVYKEEMGKVAVQRMADIILSKTGSITTTQVPVELIVRESTAGKVTGGHGNTQNLTVENLR